MYWPSSLSSDLLFAGQTTNVGVEQNSSCTDGTIHPHVLQGWHSAAGYQTPVIAKAAESFHPNHQHRSVQLHTGCYVQSPSSSSAVSISDQSNYCVGGGGSGGGFHYGPSSAGELHQQQQRQQTMSMLPSGAYGETSYDSCDADASYAIEAPPKKRAGGRRPKEETLILTPEEEEKRRLRRLRNKEAAARCRRRRLDHLNKLEMEVEQLLMEQRRLKEESERLEERKMELELLLDEHLPVCRCTPLPGTFSSGDDRDALDSFSSDDSNLPSATQNCPRAADSPANGNTSLTGRKIFLPRPNTLNVVTISKADDSFKSELLLSSTPILPMEQTPSKFFTFDPLSVPTGVTPLTHREVDTSAFAAASSYLLNSSSLHDLTTTITTTTTTTAPTSSSTASSNSKALVML
ncbi:Transcription factor kayak [Trichinella spiralis]|uniref:Transcription factor kayak n=1 Tax=Trichinella spiralis TaxID=6334 RepID=A0ABR3K5F0_TRISP